MLTAQALPVGLSIERYSVKPAPTRPSAKYQFLFTGPGCYPGCGVPVGVTVVVGLGCGEPQGEPLAAPVCASANVLANSSLNQTLLLQSTARPSWGWSLPPRVPTTNMLN